MKPILTIALMFILFGCAKQSTETDASDAFEANRDLAGDEYYDAQDRINRMQGTWVHTEDSLSVVEIKDSEWTFKYLGTEDGAPDKYTITVIDSLPQIVGTGVRSDYLILTNAQDTMHYEIEGLGPEYLIVNYLTRGNLHTYKKSK